MHGCELAAVRHLHKVVAHTLGPAAREVMQSVTYEDVDLQHTRASRPQLRRQAILASR